MGKAFQCDRCGGVEIGRSTGTVDMHILSVYPPHKGPKGDKDLCHSCAKDLREWWENDD